MIVGLLTHPVAGLGVAGQVGARLHFDPAVLPDLEKGRRRVVSDGAERHCVERLLKRKQRAAPREHSAVKRVTLESFEKIRVFV